MFSRLKRAAKTPERMVFAERIPEEPLDWRTPRPQTDRHFPIIIREPPRWGIEGAEPPCPHWRGRGRGRAVLAAV